MPNPISQYGITVSPPSGWDAVIYKRVPAFGEETFPVVHAGNFALPQARGDYGSGAVELMRPGDAFISLLEFGSSSVAQPLFAKNSPPGQLAAQDFSGYSLQRTLPGQAGVQRFFVANGRAFCLYVVVASSGPLGAVVREANQMVQSVRIGAAVG
jgi:hypothetical protein